LVKGSDGLIALDGGKLAEEFIERLAPLEIIEECLDGHSRTNKDWCPSKDVRVAVNDKCSGRHDLQYTLNVRGVPNGCG
jgi:hypothetical protein